MSFKRGDKVRVRWLDANTIKRVPDKILQDENVLQNVVMCEIITEGRYWGEVESGGIKYLVLLTGEKGGKVDLFNIPTALIIDIAPIERFRQRKQLAQRMLKQYVRIPIITVRMHD